MPMAIFKLEDIRAVAELMREYELDEYQSEHFALKKSKHRSTKPEPTPQTLLAPHLVEPAKNPWDEVPQELADQWAGDASKRRSEP